MIVKVNGLNMKVRNNKELIKNVKLKLIFIVLKIKIQIKRTIMVFLRKMKIIKMKVC